MMKNLFSFLLAMAPGLYVWWSSKRLIDRVDDPLLPELLFSQTRRFASIAASAVVLCCLLAPEVAILLVLITVLGVMVGRFPSRKAIFKESWGIWAYLSHTMRFWLALLGAWLLVAWLPTFASRTESHVLLSTILVGVVAVLWVWFQPAILRMLLRAEPLDQADSQEPFRRVLEKARCRRPTVYHAAAKGGHWVNAFALPSLERPSVLLTDGLLEALSADEVTAIFAHEVAHLEHYHPKRLLLGRLGFLVLTTIPILIWAGPYRSFVADYAWVWPLALLFALLFATTSHQKHESASDARAAELSGDPEALIRGLTKIHVLSRISRRWDSNLEQWSTHPSLARRIQNIRRQTGEKVETFDPLILPQANGSSQAVVLDAQNLHWLDGLPDERPSDPDGLKQVARERRSIPYQELRDLRLIATHKDRHLVFKDFKDRTTKMAVRAEDVELLQGVLDRVDAQVNYAPSQDKVGRSRLWAALTMLLGMMPPWSWPAVVIGAIALAKPGVAALAALGVVSLAGLVLGTTEQAWWFLSPLTIHAVHAMRGVLGLVCLGLALSHYRRKTEGTERVAWIVAMVCFCARLHCRDPVWQLGRRDVAWDAGPPHGARRVEFDSISSRSRGGFGNHPQNQSSDSGARRSPLRFGRALCQLDDVSSSFDRRPISRSRASTTHRGNRPGEDS